MAMAANFEAAPVLTYLALPPDYTPSPSATPAEFLAIHLHQLPPNLLRLFSILLTPRERTALPIIRNRRLRYASTTPRDLAWPEAHKRWPLLWDGGGRPGQEQAQEEKEWAKSGLEFLDGEKGKVGKLGQLLGEYEEEREAELLRQIRRSNPPADNLPEEENSDEDEEPTEEEQESLDQKKATFERLIKERFIYGGLDSFDYDSIDWNDEWDEFDERDNEERWFDDEEEADAPLDASVQDQLQLPTREDPR